MKKNINKNYSDFDLEDMMRTIWEKKLIVVLILSVTIMVSLFYFSKQPTSSQVSIIIKPAQYKEGVNFFLINEFVEEFNVATRKKSSGIQTSHIDKIRALDRFASEIMDFEELTFVLEKNETIKKKISKLSKEDQQRILYDYSRQLTIKQNKKSGDDIIEYELNFIWSNAAEAQKILEDVLILTEKNLGKTLINDLKTLQKIRKDQIIDKDLLQIEYLKEQSKISKALNIVNQSKDGGNLIERDLFIDDILSFLNSKIYNNQSLAFLRGSKAIEEEIEIIRNRKHVYLDKFEDRLDRLEEMGLKWVDYNLFLMKSSSNKADLRKILFLATLVGLIIAVVVVIVLNEFKSQKNSRKKLFKHRRF
jgi:LPS O-antigen subunit length determinant protein (WzzB/FepE family)